MKAISSLVIGTILAGAMFATTAIGAEIIVDSNSDVNSSDYSWSVGDTFTKRGTGKLTFDDTTQNVASIADITLEGGTVYFPNRNCMENYSSITASDATKIWLGKDVSGQNSSITALGDITVQADRPLRWNGVHVSFQGLNLGAHTLTTPDYSGYEIEDGREGIEALNFSVASTVEGGTFDVGAYRPIRFSQTLTGDFTKTGAGVLQIANTASGNIAITEGTVKVDGAGALTGATLTVGTSGTLDVSTKTGGFTLASGQTLIGSGTVTGSVTVAGTVAPGDSVGELTVDGNLALSENAVVAWEYSGGSDDLVTVTGDLGLPDAATVNVNELAAGYEANGVLFTAGSLSGATDLSGWTVNVTGDAHYKSVTIIDNQVVLIGPRGTVVMLR